MGNKNNKICNSYTIDEVSKAIEIWYNINQGEIEANKREPWYLLTEGLKLRLTKQFKKLKIKEMVRFLELAKKNIANTFQNKVEVAKDNKETLHKTTPFFEYIDTPVVETDPDIQPKKLTFE